MGRCRAADRRRTAPGLEGTLLAVGAAIVGRAAALVFVFALRRAGRLRWFSGCGARLRFRWWRQPAGPIRSRRGGLGVHGGALRARRLDELALGGWNADSFD